jgi:hypothetical protein
MMSWSMQCLADILKAITVEANFAVSSAKELENESVEES